MRFATRTKSDLTYVNDIPSAGGEDVRMFIPLENWEPEYYKLEYGEGYYGIPNYPEDWMCFRPSSKLHIEGGPANHDGRPLLGQGYIQICAPPGRSFESRAQPSYGLFNLRNGDPCTGANEKIA